jgi:hypothetical protein
MAVLPLRGPADDGNLVPVYVRKRVAAGGIVLARVATTTTVGRSVRDWR